MSAPVVAGAAEERTELEREEREDARDFILSGLEAGRSPDEILDELTSFFDGDPTDLL